MNTLRPLEIIKFDILVKHHLRNETNLNSNTRFIFH